MLNFPEYTAAVLQLRAFEEDIKSLQRQTEALMSDIRNFRVQALQSAYGLRLHDVVRCIKEPGRSTKDLVIVAVDDVLDDNDQPQVFVNVVTILPNNSLDSTLHAFYPHEIRRVGFYDGKARQVVYDCL